MCVRIHFLHYYQCEVHRTRCVAAYEMERQQSQIDMDLESIKRAQTVRKDNELSRTKE